MEEIKIQVTNKVATAIGTPTIICGNSDYAITFTFDEEWDNHPNKTARFTFFKDGIYKYIEVEFIGDACYAPILTDIDKVTVGVYAGELQTTTGADIRCKRSILCGVQVPETNVNGKVVSLNSALEHFAPAIKGKASDKFDIGEEQYVRVTIRDVSPFEHTVSINLSNELNNPVYDVDVTVRGKNLAKLEQGSIYTESGEEADHWGRVRTQFIPVIEGHTYSLSSEDSNWEVFEGYIYKEDKTLIEKGIYPETSSFTIPKGVGAYYLRMVFVPKKYPEQTQPIPSDGKIPTAITYAETPPTEDKIVTSEWAEFIPFAEDNTLSYSMLWDKENLYIAIKTQDTVVDDGVWGGRGQLGIFLNYPNHAFFKNAKVPDANATPNAVVLIYFGNSTKGTFEPQYNRNSYGSAVTPIENAGENYQFVMSRDDNNYINFFIKMNWKGFLGFDRVVKGYTLHFGAMYETNTQRTYTGVTSYKHYSAFEEFWLSDAVGERPTNLPVVTPDYAWLMIEDGETVTEYEPYVEPKTYITEYGKPTIEGVKSIYPTMIVESNDKNDLYVGTTIECEYNRDATKVIEELRQAIISLGGNV